MNIKNKKGITLIALIITIIVMLILVGVTINVAINGGIFEKAREASKQTKKQVVYETIVSSMVLTNSGMIDPVATETAALSSLNSSGIEAVDFMDIVSEEEGEEVPPGVLRIIVVDENTMFLITYSRIMDIADILAADEDPVLTWADLGVTNLTKNVNYTSEDESVTYYFKEGSEGIEICYADGAPVSEESPANNEALYTFAVAGMLTCSEDNTLDGSDSPMHTVFKFMGNTVILNPETDNTVLTK